MEIRLKKKIIEGIFPKIVSSHPLNTKYSVTLETQNTNMLTESFSQQELV